MYEGPIQDLIDELSRLPGIGPKSAQRLAFHLVKAEPGEAKRLAEVIVQAKERISFCQRVRQRRRGRALPGLPRRGPRPDRALRRRGAQGRRDDREGGRDQGAVPRAGRRDQPARRDRPRGPARAGAPRPGRARRRHRGDPRDEPEPRGQRDGDVRRRDVEARGRPRDAARERPARSAATSSTPTRSRCPRRSRAAGRCDGRPARGVPAAGGADPGVLARDAARRSRCLPTARASSSCGRGRATTPSSCLWVLDVATGEERCVFDPRSGSVDEDEASLTPTERARRERARERSTGVTQFATDRDVRRAVFSVSGRLFLADLSEALTRELSAPGAVDDPRLDPAGQRIAFVVDGSLHVREIEGGGRSPRRRRRARRVVGPGRVRRGRGDGSPPRPLVVARRRDAGRRARRRAARPDLAHRRPDRTRRASARGAVPAERDGRCGRHAPPVRRRDGRADGRAVGRGGVPVPRAVRLERRRAAAPARRLARSAHDAAPRGRSGDRRDERSCARRPIPSGWTCTRTTFPGASSAAGSSRSPPTARPTRTASPWTASSSRRAGFRCGRSSKPGTTCCSERPKRSRPRSTCGAGRTRTGRSGSPTRPACIRGRRAATRPSSSRRPRRRRARPRRWSGAT